MAEALPVENEHSGVHLEAIKLVIQDKFLSNEKVVSILHKCEVAYSDLEKKDRILAVVEHGDERAVFCMLSYNDPPKAFSDLSIERVIPIDQHFKCEIDQKQNNEEISFCLVLVSRKLRLEYEMKSQCQIDSFVDELFRGIETVDNFHSTQSFEWLQKYTRKSESQTEGSPQTIPRQTRGGSLAARESRIRYEMHLKEVEYTKKKAYTVFVATWNVNDKSPPASLASWLSVEAESPDIYAIGFQELDLSLLFDATSREEEWCDAVLGSIDSRVKYVLVERVRLVGMMLLVLIKESHYPFVSNVACDTVGTGLMGKMGNKGGVSIRFDLHNTSMCFVNSHLAAHTEELDRRNQDYRDICNRIRFHLDTHPPRSIKDHDQIYWLGDLNYRITDIDTHVVKLLLDKGNFESILENDQLTRQRRANNVFVGYQEGFITFRPTYKYDTGTDNWDSSEKNRAPAWCDRILWRGENIQQSAYRSHPSLCTSDHKPVSSTFKSQVKIILEDQYRKVYEDVIKKLDRLENELIPQVTVDRTELEFGSVRYLEPRGQTMVVANTGQVPAEFEFISKLDETSFCKEWLLVEPSSGCIRPGETCHIRLEIFVSKMSAFKLNAGTDRLYDILVLHLEGGKDIFVTVTGSYQHSCFGCSIEVLVQLKLPVSRIPPVMLFNLENKRDIAVAERAAYPVPRELWLLVDHIYMHGMREAQLFERPGLHAELVAIVAWLDRGGMGTPPGSVHSVAEALLLLLDSTAEPLVPYNLQAVCAAAADNYLQCKQIVMQLPEFRKNVLVYLCEFMREVLEHSAYNGLESDTLSALFASILLRDPPGAGARARTPHDAPARSSRALSNKKARFLHHFLVNSHAPLIFCKPDASA